MRLSNLQAILLGGLIAGTVDIGAASLINMLSPVFISQFIAGGLLGKAALTGGLQTAALGVALQWAMSIVIAAIYVFASGWLPMLRRQWALWGILYGIPVYFVMTYVVVPLSAWHRVAKFSLVPFAENMVAMMVFGLIVAFFASKTE
ncbi:MAG TPA: hypothetical protein VMF58_01570 [Rhizomicrobium sp.]|nr:hypothetical protein [Rhizomicrobium sp.]